MPRSSSENGLSMPATMPPARDASSQRAGEDTIEETAVFEPIEGNILLWQRWRDHGDAEARERLITQYLPYARMMAAMLYGRRTNDEIEFADYLQFARVGLLEAVDRYDPAQGAQFKTFASKRVQGAMLNGLAHFTERNQQFSLQMRLRQERIEAVKEAATATTAGEVAGMPSASPATPAAAGRSADRLFRYLAEVGIGLALGVMLEDTGMVDHQAFDHGEMLVPSPEVSYFRKSEIDQLRAVLRSLVDQLGEQPRTVICLHYLQEVPFDGIAAMMSVTRGRVSQLHRQGLLRLRELLVADARIDVSW